MNSIGVKLKLNNTTLGGNCYIRSDTDPIVLKPHVDLALPGSTGSPPA